MDQTNIAFLSSRGRGMDEELKLVKDYLAEHMERAAFRYFIKQEISNNKTYVRGLKAAKAELCRDCRDIICMDMSLNLKAKELPNTQKRILIYIPFNYVFDAMVQKQNNPAVPLKKGAVKYSHVYAPSPFCTQILREAYNMENVELIEGFCSPYAYEMNQEGYAQKKRETLTRYFPQSQGKKILSILMRGVTPKEESFINTDFDMTHFLRSLGEDWFVLTDSKELVRMLSHTEVSGWDSFGYIQNLILPHHVLPYTDLLITTFGEYVGYQASRRKPCYCIQWSENNVELYFENNYPALYINQAEKLYDIVNYTKENQELHSRFGTYLSYPPDQSMAADICRLITVS